jgi:hypothetical protein
LALLRYVALPGLQDFGQAQPAELVAFTGNNMPEMWARSNETLASRSDWPVLDLRVAGSGQYRDVYWLRLFGIETESAKRELYTFECTKCGGLEVRGVGVK